ncbi:divergent polysaccharide deacetylase family protein [Nitrincola tapanii]|uniref:Divergent polysaccharide deacetylase family protein n=1 Tax=Nitrincola tapanii TaxID=1708751 RepID=A0A5A9W1T2_9GAMM|nr:divergent polysaccharide deacetylase family protein [Nitrincola tapanii]KAA0874503.1 divergent polysaccharide deacetylase family protein [Nitrincola tapanii]
MLRGTLLVFLILCTVSLNVQALPAQAELDLPPRLVIIIDDVGQSLPAGQRVVDLPGPITCAILPWTPHAQTLSQAAQAVNKDVILHAPMANISDLPIGPGGLYPHQSQAELQQALKANLDSLPGVLGLNNHMGSLLTQLAEPMSWVMQVAAQRDLFFIDSRTSAQSQAARAAQQQGIPFLVRDIFLDHEITEAFVDQQFKRAVELAQRRGHAIVIGHPYPVTLDYLQQALPTLDEQGIQLVAASAFLMQEADRLRLQAYWQAQTLEDDRSTLLSEARSKEAFR